jgi:hypothetical protein
MRTRKQRPRVEKAMPDLTPMIDVTFQLLIFFILCSNFISPEEFHQADLPKTDGEKSDVQLPVEQITIYCAWDEASGTNSYVLGLHARGRVPVEGSHARLGDLVIYPADFGATLAIKKAHYKRVFDNLVGAIDSYHRRSGARVRAVEISFAREAAVGASSGTAPWIFVSLALDAVVQVNADRKKHSEDPFAVKFKFVDALGVHR